MSLLAPSALGAPAAPQDLDPAQNKAVRAVKTDVAAEMQAQPKLPKFTSVPEVIRYYGKGVRAKLMPICAKADINYPPKEMTWIALKQEMMLYVFARDRRDQMKLLLKYPIIGASGHAGPKLREGDKQVPEGFYGISGFRPQVIAHLGLDVSYPNIEDRVHARKERRKNLGSDILIHGSRWSTGCLAMGNEPIEELFVLSYDCGIKNIHLIFAPCNLANTKPQIELDREPAWLPSLYKRLAMALRDYPL